ncbi:hypothetical protein B0H19DRAFT_1069350 [Mycena capillaripes]|nr:hypothetical protein B0H19DRAFT_1069350 [Mycena capillaripes]
MSDRQHRALDVTWALNSLSEETIRENVISWEKRSKGAVYCHFQCRSNGPIFKGNGWELRAEGVFEKKNDQKRPKRQKRNVRACCSAKGCKYLGDPFAADLTGKLIEPMTEANG